jgi:type IV pilus assembly protein PilY1
MFRILKISVFFIALVLNSNANAKPVPPGAGDGDVPANILFLVDSSASMGRWIGTDGLGRATGVAYDSQGRILIGQNVRRSQGSVIRYTAAGE